MASWLHGQLFCKWIFPCGKSQHQSRATQCGSLLAPALHVASSWVAGNCFCQASAQAAALGNVVIKRDSQCSSQCFVLILFSSPLHTIMRGWIPWIMTNLDSFSFSAHSVFLLHGSRDAYFQDARLAHRQWHRNAPAHWQHPWPLAPSRAGRAGRAQVAAGWTGLHCCWVSGSSRAVFTHHCIWARSCQVQTDFLLLILFTCKLDNLSMENAKWVFLSTCAGKELSWGLQNSISTGKWQVAT